MVSTEIVALAPIDSSFINRTLVGAAGGNFLRGLIWGNVAGISQAAGEYLAMGK